MKYSIPDFQQLNHVGVLTAKCLSEIETMIKPGITTWNINEAVGYYALSNNLICATNGYRGFPANCCTSVNHVACHGIPSRNKVLKEGDIISVDVTFINKSGMHGDSCSTFFVGECSKKAKIVHDAAFQALWVGIEAAKPGNRIGHIGYAIQKHIETNTPCSIVRHYVGHGTGKKFHEPPDVPHWCRESNIEKTPLLEPGMVFTIEPIINFGDDGLKTLNDGWTTVTRDRSLSAQFEHTIGIREEGVEVFTQ